MLNKVKEYVSLIKQWFVSQPRFVKIGFGVILFLAIAELIIYFSTGKLLLGA